MDSKLDALTAELDRYRVAVDERNQLLQLAVVLVDVYRDKMDADDQVTADGFMARVAKLSRSAANE